MKENRKQKYLYFVGIDVSKLTLDFTLIKEDKYIYHKVIPNEIFEINRFVKDLKLVKGLTIKNTIFGMEQSGIYNNFLRDCLSKVKANFVMDNPLKIKNSMGLIRGKTDKLDSKRIAEYLVNNRATIQLYQTKREILLHLASLSTLRSRLVATRRVLKVPLKEDLGFVSKHITDDNTRLCLPTIKAIDLDIKAVDDRILAIWTSDESIKHKMKLMLSVDSIGAITALQILITTNEFQDITNPKSFACYCGVAPFEYKSGTSVRKRTESSAVANKKVKALIHSCAIVAITHSKDIREYYLRKIAEGKNKLSVINAIRYKLICRVFACIKENRMYTKEYVYKPTSKYQLANITDPIQLAKLSKNLTFLN